MTQDLTSEIYNMRMLVFIEAAPQSNQYRQVMLNEEEFKNVSFSFGKPTGKMSDASREIMETEVMLSDELYVLPDLKQINR